MRQAAPDLAVVIPVWNDETGLDQLLSQISRLEEISQVIVVDDASKQPADPERMGWTSERLGADLVFARNAQQRGAGYARNRGLKKVTAGRVIFFDSDDRFTPEFLNLLAELPRKGFDFCLFAHADSRVAAAGGWGPLPGDERLWERSGAFGALADLPGEGVPELIQLTAYPWNKIYRTEFLRETGIHCTEILVHNDIELHWMSFLRAARILVSDRVAAVHVVHRDGRRLTNRSGAERLEMFRALNPVATAVAAADPGFALPFARFVMALFHWASELIAPELQQEFSARIKEFLLQHMTPGAFARIAAVDPELAGRINTRLAWQPRRAVA
ncbi:glycosyltransferase [Alterinioella nitratireducens]|uniref:glycosyltransferase n=1 Tax=Rhodobacterales TaxID=204455 RepID=UPI00405911EA